MIDLRIAFMGTPGFAVTSLERLYSDGHEIVGVFTQQDKPRNRGMKVSFSPVKELALSRGTPVFQPFTLRDGEAVELLLGLDFELIVVVAYGKILPKEILGIPPLGCVNIHGSLLPKYRGAAPIQWAVINGESETGITSMYMAEELDAGDIILARTTPIGVEETAGELYERLSLLGADVLSDTIKAISAGRGVRLPQDHELATFAPPLKNDVRPIDWNDTAYNIKCKVRGLNPKPTATFKIDGAIAKVFSVDIICNNVKNAKPGEIISVGKFGIEVACADGSVLVKELQLPGRKRMSAADYIRGRRG